MDGMEWRVCLALNESEIHDRKRGARADGRGGRDAMYVSAGASARDAKLPLSAGVLFQTLRYGFPFRVARRVGSETTD